MPQNYVPIFIFIAVVGALIPITLLAAKLVRPANPDKTKLMVRYFQFLSLLTLPPKPLSVSVS